jgi:hypothetical protein
VIGMGSGPRMVLVLGRGLSAVSPSACVERAAERGIPLVLLAVGYPVSAEQRAFVMEAIERAFDARVHLDAEIVLEAAALEHYVASADEVTVVAAGGDMRRIGLILARLPS